MYNDFSCYVKGCFKKVHVFVQLQAAVGPEISKNELLLAFASVLKDIEAEVRSTAASKVKGKRRFC